MTNFSYNDQEEKRGFKLLELEMKEGHYYDPTEIKGIMKEYYKQF